MSEVQQQVRDFYDEIGWKMAGENTYQNARFEDLRPVSREYIHGCHLRVGRHLPGSGRFLLDAGSGPIQYPEYLEYSRGHTYRVCADLSITALEEARTRIGEHGLFVVCDVTQLPFASEVFEGAVTLHTFHHLPEAAQVVAYQELERILAHGSSAVVVNGWSESALMDAFNPLIRLSDRLRNLGRRFSGNREPGAKKTGARKDKKQKSTFSQHITVDWLKENIIQAAPETIRFEIRVWRSVSVRFLRALIQPWLGGRLWLRLLYWLEERKPQWFGERGAYPLIVVRKN
jgi:ubiquinone/menaquinone biosynthesis C-methylase UbiE